MAARNVFLDTASILVGADPEFFVKKGDKFISAHDFPCGTKDKPRKTAHGHVQVDAGLLLADTAVQSFQVDRRCGDRDVTDGQESAPFWEYYCLAFC